MQHNDSKTYRHDKQYVFVVKQWIVPERVSLDEDIESEGNSNLSWLQFRSDIITREDACLLIVYISQSLNAKDLQPNVNRELCKVVKFLFVS